MRISLSQLCDELRHKKRELQTDSRKVGEGDVFAAMPPAVPGEADRSAAHITMALEKGAWCVVAPASVLLAMGIDAKKDSRLWVLEDDMRAVEKDLQDMTDKFCKKVDEVCARKEKELLEV